MRYNKILAKVWDEYIVKVDRGDGMIIEICGLCANSGILNTLSTARYDGKNCGVQQPCICPNGRARRKMWK